ncbi:alpha-galactosidase [Microbacterium sp. ASV49]|uniref:Alpha-galactosidase n=1 Tax=Microbacterium candidum TaxID=3041922 RepID=A0ABT7N0H7_9MICO|nr:alpha-galactosidase [Microbacterium sp. ASV49]MDL9980211.1 alpha-galactosidase [Microbacterium sp. ASV49]
MDDVTHLQSGGVSLVLVHSDSALPAVAYWGRAFEADDATLADVVAASRSPRATSEPDAPRMTGIVPEAHQGWFGPTGVVTSRAGRTQFAAYTASAVTRSARSLTAVGRDAAADVAVELRVELTATGVVRARATLRNTGADELAVHGADLVWPIPARATELLDFTGRHAQERRPQRLPLVDGTHLREQRRGRTGPDAATLLFAGVPGFDEGAGEVWGVHLGWSGNQRVWAHRTNGGRGWLGAGELLEPEEISLAAGEAYETPWTYLAYGDGLDDASARIHEMLRARTTHPAVGRPVTLNTWEAVYFDHALTPLLELADLAADIGVERFVLDDGWFSGRRHDRAGLGDWFVDRDVWPDGLTPLVERVRERGMQFGLWFEPEMVNPDSDLARTHPEWILGPATRNPPLARNQLVLNIGDPDAFAYIAERIVDVVTTYRVDFIKWDHNRDLVEPVDRASGRGGVHRQTWAAYRLMAHVREACPWVEIESCSAGGGRIDLGVVEYVDRFWTSDSNDPIERQRIQRGTSMLMPPELLGAHVGAAAAHTSGRVAPLALRAITALVGSFGLEWDVREADSAERAELVGWIAEVKRLRPLVERGRLHRLATLEPVVAQQIVAADRGHAIVTLAALDSLTHIPGAPVRLRGLDPAARYEVVRVLPDGADDPSGRRAQPEWWLERTTWSGAVLMEIGLPMPAFRPFEAGLIELAQA